MPPTDVRIKEVPKNLLVTKQIFKQRSDENFSSKIKRESKFVLVDSVYHESVEKQSQDSAS